MERKKEGKNEWKERMKEGKNERMKKLKKKVCEFEWNIPQQ